MTAAPELYPDRVSFEEYLLGEQQAETRHEFINGEVVAMAGASDNHEMVAGELFFRILGHLRGKGCRTYKGDMKLRFQAGHLDLGYYPDVMVTCDPEDKHSYHKTCPKLLVEVMSSFKQDHLEKLFIYMQIESLEEYLIVDQDPEKPRAWLYKRSENWEMPEAVTSGEIHLASIGLTLTLADLYKA